MKKIFATALLCLTMLYINAAAPIQPGKYKKWNKLIDELDIKETFNLADYETIYLLTMPTDEVELPKRDDNNYEPVQQALKDVNEQFRNGIVKIQKGKDVQSITKRSEVTNKNALILTIQVEKMNPGSRGLRVFIGYGAGTAMVQLSGTAEDAQTGHTLLTWTHQRISPLDTRNTHSVLNTNTQLIGRDIGTMLQKFMLETK